LLDALNPRLMGVFHAPREIFVFFSEEPKRDERMRVR